MSEHEEFRESVPAWLLGALDEDEADRVEGHVQDCVECQADVARLRPAAVAIGLASPVAAMPAGLRDRIVERARSRQEVANVETVRRPAPPAIVRRPPPQAWLRLPG
ncbi:MAG TPA: zf-HC2 domain-containing protein, partial [Candidatus Dormibacteraeota bacterium]|nr:zf-HC2 domain-containing protein [Candidatus Dormibacteraeota bacterium]